MERIIEKMQATCNYNSNSFQFGVVGNFQPPEEFADFDSDYLDEFEPSNRFDQSPPPHALWAKQQDWRRRALRQQYAEHKITSLTYLYLLRVLQDIINNVRRRARQKKDAIEEENNILDSLTAPEPPSSDPSYSLPQDASAINMTLPPDPVRGVPVDLTIPPNSHARGPSPSYEISEDGRAADEPEAAATTGDDHDSSASELPVANLTSAFTQVSESGTIVAQASPFSATGYRSRDSAPPAAASAQLDTQPPPRDLHDDDPRNENYPRNAEEALDRVHAMKDWLKKGHIDGDRFLIRLNCLHHDFSGLQKLLNDEQEEKCARDEKRPTSLWGMPSLAPYRQPSLGNAAPVSSRLGENEGCAARSQSAWGSQTSTSLMTGTGEPKSGWGGSASTHARPDDAWRSGPTDSASNSPRSRSTRNSPRSQRGQSESSPMEIRQLP